MQMYECPRFEACSAQVCPLDNEWRKRRMLKREPTCHYLGEVSKPRWKVIATDAVDGFMYTIASARLDDTRQHSYALRQMLDEASKTGTYTNSKYRR